MSVGFGKIDIDNQLMSTQVQHDTSWRPLSDFVLDGNGEYYTYYITPTQPDMVKEQELVDASLDEQMEVDVSNIIVDYNGFTYSGSREAQTEMTTSMQVLEGKGDTKTRNFKDTSNVMHKLTRDDFDNLLDIIEPLYEDITDD